MLAEKTRTIERGADFKAWIRNPRGKFRSRSILDPRERAQIGSHRVILASDAGLQICDFGQGILRSIPVKERTAGFEAQVNSGQSLNVTVMQCSRDRLSLRTRFEV